MTNYSLKAYNKEHMARAYGSSLNISTKYAVEVSRMIRGKKVSRAKAMLAAVIAKEKGVSFKRSYGDMAHQREIGVGRFPVKCSIAILSLLESAEKNAQFLGLDTSSLGVSGIVAHKATRVHRYGRKRGRVSKNTHMEIVLEETKKSEPKKEKKSGKKE